MTERKTSALPVQVQMLSKHFGAVRAVDDVTFDIRPGELLTLLGPSGSGKTTLLMMIAGFSRPTQGSIRIAGQEIAEDRGAILVLGTDLDGYFSYNLTKGVTTRLGTYIQ